jgi:hypothetical protein
MRYINGQTLIYTRSGELLLEAHSEHQPIPQRDNNHKRNNTSRHTSCQKVLNLKIPLSRALVFHHDSRYVVLAIIHI